MNEIMISIGIIIWCSIFSRMAGGGIWTRRPAGIAEYMMSGALGEAVYLQYHSWLWSILAWLWSYAWFQTGHAVAFHMNNGVERDAANGRKAFLSRVIDPLCRVLGAPLGGDFYCWAFMGLKGLLMAAPLGLWALNASVLWPASYFLGNRICYRLFPKIDGEMIAEFVSGGMYGLLVAAYLFLPLA